MVLEDYRADQGQPSRRWEPRGQDFDAQQYRNDLAAIFAAIRVNPDWDHHSLTRILAQHPRDSKGYFSKIELITGYRQLVALGEMPFERLLLRRLQMKPIRTSSGVAPVTVLTEPAGCPGRCIFCPDAEGMPKSYLPNEPGARRAAQCGFDPFRQVHTRLVTLNAMGHTADKVELLILGGTWSAYPRRYREWFVKRCLDAMNCGDGGKDAPESLDLAEAQSRNESARHRNVGLVIETRPDWITPHEVRHMRYLGVTKVQLGVQSLEDRILALNRREHDVEAVRRAVRCLRVAGFKLHLHWMPNLYGATLESDQEDFARLWADPALQPDELKIYPCSIIEGTELCRIWRAGGYAPYAEEDLIRLVAECKATIPPFCRVSRVFRDIPADDIVAGSKSSNLRQRIHRYMAQHGQTCHCIRCREIRGAEVSGEEMRLVVHAYNTDVSHEQFLSYETPAGMLAGFLRLLLPRLEGGRRPEATEIWDVLPEIAGAAMIRELHVYGPALGLGKDSLGEAQHTGLGRRLLDEAKQRAHAAGFERLAVISAIGTRRYYENLGFERSGLYMITRDLRQAT